MRNLILGFSVFALIFGCAKKPEKQEVSEQNTERTEGNHPKVILHYMGWYGDPNSPTDPLRYWEHGHANVPLIGQYNSKSKATLTYHALLAWAAGIDAIAVNVKDKYDHETMAELFKTVDEIQAIGGEQFSLKYLISYDDQGFDLSKPLDTAVVKMTDFKEHLMNRKNYLRYKEHPVFFSFDYPKKYLTAESFRQVIDSVFNSNKPYLVWNTFEEGEAVEDYVNAFYPWVQPGREWDEDGLNWGDEYLKYFYSRVNEFQKEYDFVSGGVWAGFDDRDNTFWGGNRLISRQDGKVYDDTWDYIHGYDGRLPMEYVVIETWNDWNEGTEIEPSLEHGYKYLIQTVKNINRLKKSKMSTDDFRFQVAKNIHDAIKDNGDFISEKIKKSMSLFITKRFKESKENLKR